MSGRDVDLMRQFVMFRKTFKTGFGAMVRLSCEISFNHVLIFKYYLSSSIETFLAEMGSFRSGIGFSC